MDAPADLYEQDFYLWTQSQAEALRAAGRAGGRSNALEWDRLAEEVEDLGRSQRDAVFSQTVLILVHLYKLAWSLNIEPRGHWRAEVRTLRGNVLRRLTPSLRASLPGDLEALHVEAAAIAADSFATHEPATPVDPSLRWSLPQILGEERDPLA